MPTWFRHMPEATMAYNSDRDFFIHFNKPLSLSQRLFLAWSCIKWIVFRKGP
jgi:hypothetical protein